MEFDHEVPSKGCFNSKTNHHPPIERHRRAGRAYKKFLLPFLQLRSLRLRGRAFPLARSSFIPTAWEDPGIAGPETPFSLPIYFCVFLLQFLLGNVLLSCIFYAEHLPNFINFGARVVFIEPVSLWRAVRSAPFPRLVLILRN